MSSVAVILTLVVTLAGTGCAATGQREPGTSATASAAGRTAVPAPSPTLHVFTPQGGTVSGGDRYRSFRQWASLWDRVAIARVVAIEPAQWNTKDGTLPPGLDFLQPVPGNDNVLVIMRPIRFELVRALRGTWPKSDFFGRRNGGRVGNDVYETRPDPGDPPELQSGDLAVVFSFAEPIDVGGAFPLTVTSAFPVDASGAVLTPAADRTPPLSPRQTLPPPDPAGGITLDAVGQYLDLLPSPPGAG